MGEIVGFACVRGARTAGSSRFYRAVVAGLGAHVGTHLDPSLESTDDPWVGVGLGIWERPTSGRAGIASEPPAAFPRSPTTRQQVPS
jgi:hypothetical protein